MRVETPEWYWGLKRKRPELALSSLWAHGEKAAICKSGEGRSQQTLDLPVPWLWTSQPPELWEMIACCLSHQSMVFCSRSSHWQRQRPTLIKTGQITGSSPSLFIIQGIPFVLETATWIRNLKVIFPWTSKANLPSSEGSLLCLSLPLEWVWLCPHSPSLLNVHFTQESEVFCHSECAVTIISGQESVHLYPGHEWVPTSPTLGQNHAGVSPTEYRSHSGGNKPHDKFWWSNVVGKSGVTLNFKDHYRTFFLILNVSCRSEWKGETVELLFQTYLMA